MVAFAKMRFEAARTHVDQADWQGIGEQGRRRYCEDAESSLEEAAPFLAPAIRAAAVEEYKELLLEHAAAKDEWARDPAATWNAAERTVLARESQAIRSAIAALDKEDTDA